MNDNAAHLAAELIKKWEGLRLDAYPDPATGGSPWTIGYGHTGAEVTPDMSIDLDEAEAMLMSDIWECDDCISTYVNVPLTDHQYAACLSLIFNIGCGAFRNSTLLKLINAGQFDAASAQFPRWNKAGGRVMAGLTNRRNDERKMFEGSSRYEQHGLA